MSSTPRVHTAVIFIYKALPSSIHHILSFLPKMGIRYLNIRSIHDVYCLGCMLIFMLRGLMEICVSLITCPIISNSEIPSVAHVDSRKNRQGTSVSDIHRAWRHAHGIFVTQQLILTICFPSLRKIVGACPSLKEFRCAWWARGGHAQTLAQGLKSEPKTGYRREMFTIPTDGVQVALDWKDDPDMLKTCPLILCLHGLGKCNYDNELRTLCHCTAGTRLMQFIIMFFLSGILHA